MPHLIVGMPYPPDIPDSGTFHGKAGLQWWLGLTMENVQFKALEPRAFIAQCDKVVVLLHAEATIKRTGQDVSNEAAHVWTLRDDKIARHQTNEVKTRRRWSKPIASDRRSQLGASRRAAGRW